MRIYLDCISCFIRQSLEAARLATENERIHEQVVHRVLGLLAELDMHQPPAAMGQQIHRLVRELVGVEDPYHGLKQRFNDIALRLYSRMRHLINESGNPLETAVRLSIAGNIIDLGAKTDIPKVELEKEIEQSLAGDFPGGQLEAFGKAVAEADNILYLTDNAGEIVFDRLLIEQLPVEKVVVAVKGAPVINDATMEDAVRAGLPQIVEVIDNGYDAPGTVLEKCSPLFKSYFDKADLVIAKGQGNYETLSDLHKNIYFILKIKCPVIARDIDGQVGQMILQKTKACKGEIEHARI